MINRTAVTLHAKQPFLDWLRQLPDPVEPDMTLDRVNEDSSVYLVPEYDLEDEREDLLALFYEMIFEAQLEGWWTDESDWPLVRDLSVFKEWFDVAFHSVIEDLVDAPVLDDDLTSL